ncbi:MAG: hypothetical protein R2748_26050 [Bryobacterales bacterium]
MTQPAQAETVLRFGVFEADLSAGELRRNGHRLRLQEKPFQLLAICSEQRGRVVGKEELQTRLWPDVSVDADGGLNEAVYSQVWRWTIPHRRHAISKQCPKTRAPLQPLL